MIRLSARQSEIMDLVAQGKRNQEIADILMIDVCTVKNHLSLAYRKMEVRGRFAAIAKWADRSPASRGSCACQGQYDFLQCFDDHDVIHIRVPSGSLSFRQGDFVELRTVHQ